MAEESIKCRECLAEKPLSEFRRVGKPGMCKACIAERKAKKRLSLKVEKAKAVTDAGKMSDASEPRTALRLDTIHRGVLDALTKRLDSSQSRVVEKALDLLFGELFAPSEQELILRYAGLFTHSASDTDAESVS